MGTSGACGDSAMAPVLKIVPEDWAEALSVCRARRPLIYAVTNYIAASFQANAILAVGASPVMSPCIHEAEELARSAEGVLINTGAPSEDRELLIRNALTAAEVKRSATLLDPVGYGAASFRRQLVDALLRDFRFAVVKGNRGEISLLAGEKGDVKGGDSEGSYASIVRSVRTVAVKTRSLVCATGETDVLSDGDAVLSVRGGSALLGRITGGGCVLGALMLTLSTAASSISAGVVCASVLLRLAAERAEKISNGPGTFQAHLLDALHKTHPEELLNEAWRVEEVTE